MQVFFGRHHAPEKQEGRRASDAGSAASSPQSSKTCGTDERSCHKALSEQKYTTCKHGSRVSWQRWRKMKVPETRGQPKDPAAGGANQVPQPATPVDLQGKHLDENMDDALDLGANRPTVQSPLSPTQEADLVDHRTADGGLPQDSN